MQIGWQIPHMGEWTRTAAIDAVAERAGELDGHAARVNRGHGHRRARRGIGLRSSLPALGGYDWARA